MGDVHQLEPHQVRRSDSREQTDCRFAEATPETAKETERLLALQVRREERVVPAELPEPQYVAARVEELASPALVLPVERQRRDSWLQGQTQVLVAAALKAETTVPQTPCWMAECAAAEKMEALDPELPAGLQALGCVVTLLMVLTLLRSQHHLAPAARLRADALR